MTEHESDELVASVAQAVQDIKFKMGLRDWIITVKGGTDAEVRHYSGQEDVLACTGIFIGNRRANITVNIESNWEEYLQLEGSVLDVTTHELMHVVLCDVGMARDGKLVTSHMEEGIDRIVSIINGGENEYETEACTCGSHIRHRDE